jgi:hypothetical protein
MNQDIHVVGVQWGLVWAVLTTSVGEGDPPASRADKGD